VEAPRDNYIIDGGQTRSEPNQIQASFLPVRVEENPATAPSHPIDMQSEFKREGEGGRGGAEGRAEGRQGRRQAGRKKENIFKFGADQLWTASINPCKSSGSR